MYCLRVLGSFMLCLDTEQISTYLSYSLNVEFFPPCRLFYCSVCVCGQRHFVLSKWRYRWLDDMDRTGLIAKIVCTLSFWAISLPFSSFETRLCGLGWPLTCYVPKVHLMLDLLNLPLKCWDCRCMPPYQVDAVLGTESRASHVFGNCSTNWAMPPGPGADGV